MAKRSPILGYNHNVRYRGLVFHVQTEDSGLLSPHLFTHLFHGGVIISTRKLVYDAGAAEDAIKSLMQAQHKAVLKDLKKGSFDDKIDQYLAGTPGLLPRGAADDGDAPELARASTPAIPAPPIVADPAAPVEPASSRARTLAESGDDPNATVPTSVPEAFVDHPSEPHIEIQLEPDEPDDHARGPRDTEVHAVVRPDESTPPPISPNAYARAPSAVGAATLPPARPIARPPSRPAITPPQVVSRPLVDRSDAVEVYAPAPPTADLPPGMADRERPGQYAQHKKASQKMPMIGDRPAPPPPPAAAVRPSRMSSAPSSGVPRPVGRDTRDSSGASQIAKPRTTTPSRGGASGRPSTTNGSGVVMTRPAVIVGAPAKPANAPPRVRKAREDEGRGFGQGLISEKSLDEVILAYLSEDADDK